MDAARVSASLASFLSRAASLAKSWLTKPIRLWIVASCSKVRAFSWSFSALDAESWVAYSTASVGGPVGRAGRVPSSILEVALEMTLEMASENLFSPAKAFPGLKLSMSRENGRKKIWTCRGAL